MVIIAKARGLDFAEYSSLKPLLAELLRKARKPFDIDPLDPLLTWLVPNSGSHFRSIEAGIQKLLIDDSCYQNLNRRGLQALSDLAAFFYVALFRTLRRFLRPFLPSNPTWVKKPKRQASRLRPDAVAARVAFRSEVEQMLTLPAKTEKTKTPGKKHLAVASSESLPLRDEAIDLVLSSPPYCTRIDYAVATAIELAALGYSADEEFDLRRCLIGNTTVPKTPPSISTELGSTCLRFLKGLAEHPSKASSTYYLKNHLQYFHSIRASLAEISRVMRTKARCLLVVQDSYYKNLHNDLPRMFVEMAARQKLTLVERRDFPLSRTMAGINPRVNDYRESFSATESVLSFVKSSSLSGERA